MKRASLEIGAVIQGGSVFGGLLALVSAVTFAITNAAVRRGVISGSAVQATTLSIPVGVPIFFCWRSGIGGGSGVFRRLPRASVIAFAITGRHAFRHRALCQLSRHRRDRHRTSPGR